LRTVGANKDISLLAQHGYKPITHDVLLSTQNAADWFE
jgi:hypothetical protein